MYFEKYHTTREGKTMLIAEMGTEHIIKTIRFFMRTLDDMIGKNVASQKMQNYQARIYGRQPLSDEDIARAISETFNKIQPYVIELFFFRGDEMNVGDPDILEIIQTARQIVGRSAQLNTIPMLESGFEHEQDGENEDEVTF